MTLGLRRAAALGFGKATVDAPPAEEPIASSPRQLLRATAREFTATYLVAAAVTCFVNIGLLIVPFYDILLYDRVLSSRSIDSVIVLSAICVAGMTVYGILEYLRSCIFLVMGDRLARRLTIPALRAAITESLAGNASTGGQALRDLNELRLFVTGSAAAIPLDLLWLPALVTVLYMLHPLFAYYALGCAACLFSLSLATDALTRRQMAAAEADGARTLNDVAASLRNVDLIHGMGMLPALTRRWRRRQDDALDVLDRATARTKAFLAAAKSLRLLMQGGTIAIGIVLVLHEESSPGAMMGANIIVAKLLQPFELLVSGWRQWVFALSALNRVRAVLSSGSARSTRALRRHRDGRLVVENLTFSPPGRSRPALDSVSFSLEPGDILGVIGPSAAGKSSLARLLVGVWQPTSGHVRFDGQDIYHWERADFGRHAGYLPQNVGLLDGTVFDNIARLQDADPADVVDAARRAEVHDMIGRLPLGYSTMIGSTGFLLSGGQRQRLGLARALFGNPRLLVLDEPNASLDQIGEAALISAVKAARDRGAIVVIIAHRPSLLAISDKLLVLRAGMVEHFGPRDEIVGSLGIATAPAAPPATPPAPATQLVRA